MYHLERCSDILQKVPVLFLQEELYILWKPHHFEAGSCKDKTRNLQKIIRHTIMATKKKADQNRQKIELT